MKAIDLMPQRRPRDQPGRHDLPANIGRCFATVTLGAMVIVRRDGFSNDQWLLEGVNLLDLKYRAAGYFAADPSQLVRPNRCRDPLHRRSTSRLPALPRNDFDYVWLIDAAAL